MSLVSYIIEQANRDGRSYDIFSRLLSDRIVMLNEEVDNVTTSLVTAQLLYLEGQDPSKDISLYIDSPDGFVTVDLAIYDTVQYIKCDVSTICIGTAASMGAFSPATGVKDKRFALPNNEITIHQPSDDARGQATDTMIHTNHIIATKKKLNEILAGETEQPIGVIMKDTERDNFMTIGQIAAYGLVDKVITKRQLLCEAGNNGMPNDDDTKERGLYCSFCGRPQNQARHLIAGPGVYICDECVQLCNSILEGESHLSNQEKTYAGDTGTILLKPQEVKKKLDEHVIGQDKTRVALSVAVHNHYKCAYYDDEDVEIGKNSVLSLDPTGVGRTLLARMLTKLLDVPFAVADATTLTEASYVGEDVGNVLLRPIQATDFDIERAENGIIYIDEIDKIAGKSENPSITCDISDEGVQQTLLKILEDSVCNVPPQGDRKHPQQEFLQIDTLNILFICGGALDGLEKTTERRTTSSSVGFGVQIKNRKELDTTTWMSEVVPRDLVKYGLVPELVSRLLIITALNGLDEEALIRTLTEPESSLVKRYKYLFQLDKVDFDFQPDTLREIAKGTIEHQTGAYELCSILEEILTPLMYDVPSRYTVEKVMITPEAMKKGAVPELVYNENRKPVRIKISNPQKRRRKDTAS